MSLLDWENNHPQTEEYSSFYKNYIDLIDAENVVQKLIQQGQKTYAVLQKLTSEEASYRYADDKWSVQEVIGHLVDTERIMAYRALCISRGDDTPLPGYNHEAYVEQANFESRSLQSLSTEYDALRNANISMFNSFNSEQIKRKGTANNATISVRALAYIIAGHEKHHLNILQNKYGIDISISQDKK